LSNFHANKRLAIRNKGYAIPIGRMEKGAKNRAKKMGLLKSKIVYGEIPFIRACPLL
jgi:hypothetical protein